MPLDIIDEAKNNFNGRLQNINWNTYYNDLPFNPSALSLYKWAPISDELKIPLIWVSKSVRSTKTITVGLFNAASRRSFCAAKTINSDLPEPWKCQIRPFLSCHL